MSKILPLACRITGDEYPRLAQSTPESRRKVLAMAVALLVPTLVWTGASFMLAFSVLKASVWASLLTAVVAGTIVFSIERLIVMARGNGWLVFFRILVGMCTALLGAVVVDEVVFAADIDQQMQVEKQTWVKRSGEAALAQFWQGRNEQQLRLQAQQAMQQWQQLEKVAREEADGTGGSGQRGVDQVTRFKQAQAADAKAIFDKWQTQLEQAELAAQQAQQQAETDAANRFNMNSLLLRIKALFALIRSDVYMMIIYGLFTGLMFLLEFLVIVFKMTWRQTAYEYQLQRLEEVHRQRTDRALSGGATVVPGTNEATIGQGASVLH